MSKLNKILDNFATAIESGDMVLDVKEMETIPDIKKLILEVLENNTTIEHSDVEGDYEYLDIEGFKKELNDL